MLIRVLSEIRKHAYMELLVTVAVAFERWPLNQNIRTRREEEYISTVKVIRILLLQRRSDCAAAGPYDELDVCTNFVFLNQTYERHSNHLPRLLIIISGP